jgi:hypothetical protein
MYRKTFRKSGVQLKIGLLFALIALGSPRFSSHATSLLLAEACRRSARTSAIKVTRHDRVRVPGANVFMKAELAAQWGPTILRRRFDTGSSVGRIAGDVIISM